MKSILLGKKMVESRVKDAGSFPKLDKIILRKANPGLPKNVILRNSKFVQDCRISRSMTLDKSKPLNNYCLHIKTLLIPTRIRISTFRINSKHVYLKLTIGLLQQTITWYKIGHAGGQAHYYSRTGTVKQRPVTLDWLTSLCFNVSVRKYVFETRTVTGSELFSL